MVHLFIHLLISANHRDGEWQGIELKRGQLATGRKALAEQTGISESTIRTIINRLISTSEITIKSTNKYSVITICNYDSYQGGENEINQQTNQQTNQQLASKTEKINHKQEVYKNNKNIFIVPTLNEVSEYVKEKGVNVDPVKFWNFYESKGWMVGKNKMRNWHSAIATWVKQEKPEESNRIILPKYGN